MSGKRYLSDQFLIASPGLQDPNFARGVTLICQHDEDGAMGLMVNRPSDYHLGDVLKQMNISTDLLAISDAPVLIGGPVQPERGFVLHSPERDWESSLRVSDQLMVTTSRDILDAMANGEGPKHAMVMLGYSGWTAGQLEDELIENAWLTCQSSTQILFETPAEQRWLAAAQQLGIDLRLMTDYAGHA
ncbi:MAG: YqgE/AlgH family protein [Rhodanobacteraceae bacterium]|nr:YqgE/AlgH family protein [Xanthomonadales bacterium]MCP5479383.1 YqgE/AlgH family protein [Rhodanobacteraceae bacterium]HPF72644.1 YqgE/AlgH family protein [Xanthomonadaceae bacterium]HRY00071.1 YqgE/AlgH family protein [Xanthomonadaceae bacterium]